jgi:uncharacterized protein YcbK (DUF882 family)
MHGPKDAEHRSRPAWLNRRSFLTVSAASAAALFTLPSLAKVHSARERGVSLYNLHTGEQATAVYWANGEFVEGGLQELNRVLRDHRTGDVYPMDTDLFDLLCVLRTRVDGCKPFQVISGYRSPETNAFLRKHGSGVARHSYHMQGMAIDIRLEDCALDHLHKAALALRGGGVGYYPDSDFIHVDVGPLRRW